MRFGPTLIGAIVGAAVGVALHVALEVGLLGRQIEAPWFAVIIGILTGLGVRQANKGEMHHVSYARGALSGIVALAAIVGSIYAVGAAMRMKDQSDSKKPAAAKVETPDAETDDAKAGDAAAEAPEPESRPAATVAGGPGGAGKLPARGAMDTVQMVCMIIGAFIAYEFGRGAGAKRPEGAPGPDEAPVATDPSN